MRTNRFIFRERTGSLLVLASAFFMCGLVSGQNLTPEPGAPDMSSMSDVLKGQQFLLKQDDIMLLSVYVSPSATNTDLISFPTYNSHFGAEQTINLVSSGEHWSGGVQGSAASGRMYNIGHDVVATIAPASTPAKWTLNLLDPATNQQTNTPINSQFDPYQQIWSQAVMGDFDGDGLSDVLVFYASITPGQKTEWGMSVFRADDKNTVGSLQQGPQFYYTATLNALIPVTGSIVVGDFDGDGQDEIAALLTDFQTIQFYKVDKSSLAVTPSASLKLQNPISFGTLAAGRFRNTPNDELVAVGQSGQPSPNFSIYAIQTVQMDSQGNPQLKPAIAQTKTVSVPGAFALGGILAQAAPIVDWYLAGGGTEQLVLGVQYAAFGFASDILIGTFDSNFNFVLDLDQNVEAPSSCLLEMQIGNFDHQQTPDTNGNTHDPHLQLALFEAQDGPSACTPRNGVSALKIVNINVPNNFNPLQPGTLTNDWLADSHVIIDSFKLPSGHDTMQVLALGTGDLQGRSLRLGAPTKVIIPEYIQPDIVLGMPPMHVDYVPPSSPDVHLPNKNLPGCTDLVTPCDFNVSVLPSLNGNGNVPFTTSFDFTSTSSGTVEKKTTTSWGVSVKATAEAWYGSGIPNAVSQNYDVKISAGYAHNETVASQYNTYQGVTDSEKTQTGFADIVYYTEREMNVYYYPVLGRTGCPANNPTCTDAEKTPLYVEFSIPDQVKHAKIDGTTLEWYQPVQEPGNLLSYPGSESQLIAQFDDTLKILNQNPTTYAIDSSQTILSTSWTGNQNDTKTAGATHSTSGEISASYSVQTGKKGEGGSGFSASLDVAGNWSLNSLNVSSSSLSASSGIAISKSTFNSDLTNCCLYDFTGLIFGKSNPIAPVFQTDVSVDDPDTNKPVDIGSTGPLYVSYFVQPDAQWWHDVYALPDVGFNHPARWGWNRDDQVANFNPACDYTDCDPLDASFYQMKGFFVTKTNSSNPGKGPNLGSAVDGDQLTLTARVYNYSLVSTNAPIHVRFYGQYYCSSGSANEKSCVDPNGTTCPSQHLCGPAFPIGIADTNGNRDAIVSSIPAWNSSADSPNWVPASVTFDTSGYGNTNMTFWVITWMQNSQGILLGEMPGHGLTAIPSNNITQITDVPIEMRSNNVGMWGVHTPFSILAKAPGGVLAPTSGTIARVTLNADQQVQLGQRDKISIHLDTEGGDIGPLTFAYFDGNPGSGGKLFDVQHVAYVPAAVGSYEHRVFFNPESCGDHTIFTETFGAGARPSVAQSPVIYVGLDPIAAVQHAITTISTQVDSSRLRAQLLDRLNSALLQYRHYRIDAGNAILRTYRDMVRKAIGTAITAKDADSLLAQAGTTLDCNAHPGAPRVIVNQTLSRDAQNNIVANVTLTNTGITTAADALVTIANVGATSATTLPVSPVDIGSESSTSLKLIFPASVGDPGKATTFTIGGTYGGNSFNFTSRITLP